MGSIISPTIANIVTNEILDNVTNQLLFKPKLITKYVDDLLTIAPRRQVNDFLAKLNSFNARIKFTIELEENDKLPYLDMLLLRQNNKIVTDWYKKPSASNKTLSFLSNHPLQMRKNVAYNMFLRSLSISDKCFHKNNIQRVTNILRENNFPMKIIVEQMHKVKNKINNIASNNIPSPNNNEDVTRKALTYTKKSSDIIKQQIEVGTKNKIKVSYKPHLCLRKTTFSQLKSKIAPLNKTNVIYKIPCNGNNNTKCDKTYVGQTKNKLESRLKQHKRDITNNYNPNGQSAVVTHFEQVGHVPAFDKTLVLSNESQWHRRLTRESLHILTENTYNLRRDTNNISGVYCALLNGCKLRR